MRGDCLDGHLGSIEGLVHGCSVALGNSWIRVLTIATIGSINLFLCRRIAFHVMLSQERGEVQLGTVEFAMKRAMSARR